MEFTQVFAIVFFSLLIICLLGYYRSRKNAKKDTAPDVGAAAGSGAKKDTERNGNDDDVKIFADKLLRFARKAKVRLIIPAVLRYNGKDTRLSAILVGHGGMLGIYCVGYGGTMIIPPDDNAPEWTQEINGRTKSIRNPLKSCEAINREVEAIMQDAGIPGKMRTAAVFTTPKVTLRSVPQNVYTSDSLFYYLDNAGWVKEGSLNMDETADALQALVPMDELKEAAKEKR